MILLSACSGLLSDARVHLDLTNTGPAPIDVTYASGDLRQTVEVPGCSRVVVSVPRADEWDLVIDDVTYQSSRDGSIRELEGTLTIPIHFDAAGGGFDLPFSGAPDSAEARIGTEC